MRGVPEAHRASASEAWTPLDTIQETAEASCGPELSSSSAVADSPDSASSVPFAGPAADHTGFEIPPTVGPGPPRQLRTPQRGEILFCRSVKWGQPLVCQFMTAAVCPAPCFFDVSAQCQYLPKVNDRVAVLDLRLDPCSGLPELSLQIEIPGWTSHGIFHHRLPAVFRGLLVAVWEPAPSTVFQ